MTEITESLEAALTVLQKDSTTRKRLSATSSLIADLEAMLYDDDNKIDPKALDTSIKTWKEATQTALKTKNTALVKFGKTLSPLNEWSLADAYLYHIDKETCCDTIDNLIKLHLIRNANVHIFSDDIDSSLLSKFNVMNSIEEDILNGDLNSAILWCQQNLPSQSELLFQLHQLQFRQLLNVDTVNAFKYAKETFPQFTTASNLQSISKLMSCMLFSSPESPIETELLNRVPTVKIDLQQLSKLFAQSFSNRLGFPVTSTLDTILFASHLALPTVIKFTNIQRQRRLNWSTIDELPFEIKLPEFLKFHAVFICPVSKEETGSLGNEAYGLPCGHIISKISLERLSGKNTGPGTSCRVYGNGGRFKCPYCPNIAGMGECREVRFYRL